jgi:hypothetical protein
LVSSFLFVLDATSIDGKIFSTTIGAFGIEEFVGIVCDVHPIKNKEKTRTGKLFKFIKVFNRMFELKTRLDWFP